MPRTKKVVSVRMAKLLEKQTELKAVIKENRKAAGLHSRATTQLYRTEDKIDALAVDEARKAVAKQGK